MKITEETKFITVMPDGTKWAVPVMVIARSRAAYLFDHHPDEFNSEQDALENDTIPLFESDDFEIEDWAQNNIKWADVFPRAVQISGAPPCNYNEGWVNGDHEVVEK